MKTNYTIKYTGTIIDYLTYFYTKLFNWGKEN